MRSREIFEPDIPNYKPYPSDLCLSWEQDERDDAEGVAHLASGAARRFARAAGDGAVLELMT